MKHSICNVEFSTTDLDRAAQFYQGLFGWSFSAAADSLHFRSPDGLNGMIRLADNLTPRLLPLLRVEVDDYTPLFDLAARLNGGYSGFVDPVGGDWTVNLRDPDGNLIRLARSSVDPVSRQDTKSLEETAESTVDAIPAAIHTAETLPKGKPGRASIGKAADQAHPRFPHPNGQSSINGNGRSTTG